MQWRGEGAGMDEEAVVEEERGGGGGRNKGALGGGGSAVGVRDEGSSGGRRAWAPPVAPDPTRVEGLWRLVVVEGGEMSVYSTVLYFCNLPNQIDLKNTSRRG